MRFSRLKLNGFKSFVDPTDLVIGDGLTGVVGPNGCGKSNLLEALRWVMGENRPTAMRGGGMEDVIFAGAATRPARNFAEVSLLIDNAERLAPKEFNDSDQLDIVRRITRDAGSAYKAQGKDVRARDVQMLFADASTGSHSPALVRQGQISELINARPKARRRVLEEAAGISGLYQRRHEAELKLKSTETNLARVDDVVENLAGQLQQLARQARQAARYRRIGEQLRRAEGLLLYRRWREASQALAEAENELREAVTAAARTEGEALRAAKARQAAEEALPPLREGEAAASAAAQRLTVEMDSLKIRGEQATAAVETLRARIGQLAADAEREAALGRDAEESIARLEVENAGLSEAIEGHEAKLAEAKAEASDAAQVLRDRETTFAQGQEDVARLAARHQSATRLFEDSERRLERAEAAESKCRSELESAQAAERASSEALESARGGVEAASEAARSADAAFTEAEDARSAAQAREADARSGRSAADGEAAAIKAEVSALERLVERGESDAEMLLDRLRVEEGFEMALGAALADDLRAAEVEADKGSGWVRMEDYGQTQALPDGAARLTAHVGIPDVLARRMSQVGLVEPEDGPRLQGELKPGQRLVSRRGDLWRWDGYRAGAEDSPSASALRLQHLNRLEILKRDLNDATAKAENARRAHEDIQAELERLTTEDRMAREARNTADQALTDANRTLSRAEGELSAAAGRVVNLSDALTRASEEGAAARVALTEAEAGLRGLGDLDAARLEIDAVKSTVEAARVTMMSLRAEFDEVRREGETREKRIAAIDDELKTWRGRATAAEGRVAEVSERRERSVGELAEAEGAPARIANERAALSKQFETVGERRAKAADALAEGETALRAAQDAERKAEREASDARAEQAAANARREAASGAVEAASARIGEELETTPEELLRTLDADPDDMPPVGEIDTEVVKLRRQRDALGAVNLRAEEDAKEVQKEHDGLVGEKADLESAVAKLRFGISSLNKEGRERLLTAFEEVNRSFGALFTHLFGGGEAKLVLVESDDPLEAGLEIMCQPPGKKLSVLSLLSGGEQTLTALALIFAVFLANPAPICVLDEVDAPLDDANVTRFCGLLDEMTRRTNTRFLIITHHVITMNRMDRLFGVTMAEQGVSQLVSVDLKQAEKMVA